MSEPLALWEGVGVEIEYMIVDAAILDVKPVADRLLAAALPPASGPGSISTGPGDIDRGAVAWSNELALHVVELKTAGPARSFAGLAGLFQESLTEIVGHLRALGARAMAPVDGS